MADIEGQADQFDVGRSTRASPKMLLHFARCAVNANFEDDLLNGEMLMAGQ